MTVDADFSGYATRNDVRCSDGRTILADAFLHQDGETVPLVWQHGHDSPFNVLGHVKLQNVADGVKAHAFFNKTDAAQHMKESVRNGDVKFLSIFANQLREIVSGGFKSVKHGMIREVSLVLAGANPGAKIDNPVMAHSDGEIETFTEEAEITMGIEIELSHAATAPADEATTTGDGDLARIVGTFNDEQREAFNFLLSEALLKTDESVQHSDSETDENADADDESAENSSEEDETPDADVADGTPESDENAETDAEDEGTDADGADENSDEVDEDADTSDTSDSEDENSSETDSDTSSESEAGDEEAVQHDNTQEENSMTHNVFSQGGSATGTAGKSATLSHDAMKGIIKDASRRGSLKEALEDYVVEHGVEVGGTLEHGIENIEFLFPDPKTLSDDPTWIMRRIEWVDKVLDAVRKTPFSRIRTIHADITADEARARGYIKGNMKKEEFFELVKRDTTPQTIYKKQKLDRDDVVDITNMNVIAFVKMEMMLMLKEELAGAILIGDGRSNGDEDKIKEDKIRPIATDAELYVTTININLDDTNSDIEELVDSVISTRQYYKGTGLPTFYTSEEVIGQFLTAKDGFDQRRYKSLDDVKSAMRVADIVPVDVFTRAPAIVGILVNLNDYSLGTDRGGEATMFDDFDLDFNKLRYLLETRASGALTIPKAAIVYRRTAAGDVEITNPTAPSIAANVVTIPTVTHVAYKNADSGATLTNGSTVTLTSNAPELNVTAVAASGYFFADSEHNDWSYEYDENA